VKERIVIGRKIEKYCKINQKLLKSPVVSLPICLYLDFCTFTQGWDEWTGELYPDILDNLVGDFKRALDRAVETCLFT
jgi:hypothetical protein